jgi:hypothetical protein
MSSRGSSVVSAIDETVLPVAGRTALTVEDDLL